MSLDQHKTPHTTGHTWDGDLQEFTNPVPRWWTWCFYLTAIFTVIYWLLYPAWPVGATFTKGVPGLNSVTYTATTTEGKEVEKTTHWNMRSQFMAEMNQHEQGQKQWFDKVAAMPFEQVAQDADLMQFVNSAGKTLFSDNCAPCHQPGGQGKIGFSPNLTDDHWQYGGTYDHIQQTLMHGRSGYMPSFSEVLNESQITELANYVLSLSGEPHDTQAASAGAILFKSETAACYYCHGADAKGREVLGSANLTDKIWLWANVPALDNAGSKLDEVKRIIASGLDRGVMPNWDGRLKPEQIKLLTVYVHDSLGGGN